jgi:hypothetical protein
MRLSVTTFRVASAGRPVQAGFCVLLVAFLAGNGYQVQAARLGTAPVPASGTLVIRNQSHKVFQRLKITSLTGDCVQIVGSHDITIENSEIGPCAGNGVSITGGGGIRVYDSYVHPETLSPGCCDHNDGILAQKTSQVIVQGNVIAYSESNVEAPQGVSGLAVIGNFLLNPRGPFPRGQNVQAWNATNVVVRNNYTLSSVDVHKYLYAEHQEDSINFGHAAPVVAEGNYVTGGHSPSGCGLLADVGANSIRLVGNDLVDTGQCGIGVASGTNQLVDDNEILNRTPVQGGGNTALYVWNQYPSVPCGPVTVSNNIATEIRKDGSQSGFWDGGGCQPVGLTGNTWDEAARRLLTPVRTKLPPPLIPPQPKSCVVRSPYSTQTKWRGCN